MIETFFISMKLDKEEMLYYINHLENKIKSTKVKKLKDKYTNQKNALVYLLLKNK